MSEFHFKSKTNLYFSNFVSNAIKTRIYLRVIRLVI